MASPRRLTKDDLAQHLELIEGHLWRKPYIDGKKRLKKLRKVVYATNTDGYFYTTIKRRPFLIHRILWAFYYGEVPADRVIDHINGDRKDNRIENLRLVTVRENMHNTKFHRNGGLIGTTYDKHVKKWNAQITIKRENRNLGYFLTAEEAHAAYMKAYNELGAR